MKINKITSHFLKRIKKGWDIRYCQYDEKYLITDGYKLFLLNEDEVQFNLSLANKGKFISRNMGRCNKSRCKIKL